MQNVFFQDISNFNNLFFIIFETKNNGFLALKKENDFNGLFFDLVLTSNKDNIKFQLNKIDVKNIFPVIDMIKIYQEMEKISKNRILITQKQNIFFNEEDKEKINITLTDRIIKKEDLELFMDYLKLIQQKEVEPIYLPNKDIEKEKSF